MQKHFEHVAENTMLHYRMLCSQNVEYLIYNISMSDTLLLFEHEAIFSRGVYLLESNNGSYMLRTETDMLESIVIIIPEGEISIGDGGGGCGG